MRITSRLCIIALSVADNDTMMIMKIMMIFDNDAAAGNMYAMPKVHIQPVLHNKVYVDTYV